MFLVTLNAYLKKNNNAPFITELNACLDTLAILSLDILQFGAYSYAPTVVLVSR